jgi:aminoglycoside phosphotransferase (APT) family kinase protein
VTTRPQASQEQVSALVRAACPDWRLLRTWPLAGGVSSQVSAVEVEASAGSRRTLVLRQYGAGQLASNPRVADTEYRLLRLLSSVGLPVPQAYLADESGAIVPGPCLLEEFIDGEGIAEPADLADFTAQLASALAALHDIGVRRADVPFLADARAGYTRRIGTWSPVAGEHANAEAIRATLAASWPPPRINRPVVLHGDYWPGNVLWRNGRLAGVIDWEDAEFGDPLADVAIMRSELSWSVGIAGAEEFTSRYQKLQPGIDYSALPVWDLVAGLRACQFDMETWGLPAAKLAAMRGAFREFAAGALARVTGREAPQ